MTAHLQLVRPSNEKPVSAHAAADSDAALCARRTTWKFAQNSRGFVLPCRNSATATTDIRRELLSLCQQLRQLRNIHHNPPRLTACDRSSQLRFVVILFLVRFVWRITHTSRSPLIQKFFVGHSTDNARSRFKIETMSTRRAIERHQSPHCRKSTAFATALGDIHRDPPSLIALRGCAYAGCKGAASLFSDYLNLLC